MKTLVFATNNAHKLEELRAIAADTFDIRSLNDIGCHDDIPENADTLEGNARQKARWIYERYGVDCLPMIPVWKSMPWTAPPACIVRAMLPVRDMTRLPMCAYCCTICAMFPKDAALRGFARS